MKRLAAALALGTLLATPAHAGRLVDLAVIDRTTGQRLPVHGHQGRLYVAGTPGAKYAVFVANRTGQRVMTVVSVDGINAVTGETASPGQNGYVLGPGQSFEIAGWRKSTNEVAAFYFTRLPDSYAARTERPENVGVIGVAVFREWQAPRPRPVPQPITPPLSRHGDAAAEAEAPAADSPAGAFTDGPGASEGTRDRRALQQERIGTGHGERERSDVVYTTFRRATPHAAETLTIHYDTYANLVARGIVPRAPRLADPNPFPAGRFVPDPQG